jgi:DDE superfamily endonuclease
LQNGALNSTMSFELRNQHSENTRAIKGAYVIVDNGYLNWSTTVPPMKNSCNRSEIRFSQWLESLRKDVECTFGILKGRWRVLKSGIRVHNTEVADNIWLTCCALHNLLLDVDGLSVGWQHGVPSHWESQRGQFEVDDVPDSIRRLMSPVAIRTYDRSSFGGYNPASTIPHHVSNDDESNAQQRIIQSQRIIGEGEDVAVNELPLSQFRAMLIEHFNVLFHEQKIAWPKRLAATMPPRHVPN